VTANVRVVEAIPSFRRAIFEARGEVYAPKADCALNARQAAGKRSRQSGSRPGSAPARSRSEEPPCSFRLPGNERTLRFDSLAFIRCHGASPAANPMVKSSSRGDAGALSLDRKRATLNDIDGVVYKVNDLALQQRLSCLRCAWAVAAQVPATTTTIVGRPDHRRAPGR
jgi:NAD-dependent DNA ligase